jgi:hypothetical protein
VLKTAEHYRALSWDLAVATEGTAAPTAQRSEWTASSAPSSCRAKRASCSYTGGPAPRRRTAASGSNCTSRAERAGLATAPVSVGARQGADLHVDAHDCRGAPPFLHRASSAAATVATSSAVRRPVLREAETRSTRCGPTWRARWSCCRSSHSSRTKIKRRPRRRRGRRGRLMSLPSVARWLPDVARDRQSVPRTSIARTVASR